ncbi:MAG: M20/M25/M40 family metallo-hydrolase [Firmicutes bacterium]|nr:M20/M25/M40 family metallo-hydrolase [Bacillota bacterium]
MRRWLVWSMLVVSLGAQESLDTTMMARIREEGLQRSQVPRTLHELCDGHGPRLTGSPQFRAAAQWAAARLTQWGLAKAALEPWDLGHGGWTNLHQSVHALAPYESPLHVEVVAWTPSTRGTVKGTVARLDIPEEPLPAELAAAFAALKDKVRGKVVFVGRPKTVPVLWNRYAPRLAEEDLLKRFDPAREPEAPRITFDRHAPKRPGAVRAREVDRLVDQWLVSEGALARVNDAGMRNGLIRAFNNRTFDGDKAVPTVVMRAEDYGRLWQLMGDGKEARLELDIRNRFHPESNQGYNVVAELTGTEKPHEVILLGAHLDSWHTGTGATDDGASCVAMMEALRILKATGAAPKRTIRVVLFGGEELGLLGSTAYVKAHYGAPGSLTDEAKNLVAYFNMDGGAGMMRGLSVFGPPASAQVLRELMAPFKDLGVVGANHHRTRLPQPDYADITVFTHAGLTGIGLVQDPLEYSEVTWHTSVDTLERVPVDDISRTATVMASVAYHLANRAEKLPAFTKEDLPPIPALPAALASPSK